MNATVSAHASQRDRVALQAFERIASAWKLSIAERRMLLGGVPKTTYDRWRRAPDRANLTTDTLERISHVLGMYKALHVIFTDAGDADAWIGEPNTRFGGASAKAHMLGSFTQLVETRRYLDTVRGS